MSNNASPSRRYLFQLALATAFWFIVGLALLWGLFFFRIIDVPPDPEAHAPDQFGASDTVDHQLTLLSAAPQRRHRE